MVLVSRKKKKKDKTKLLETVIKAPVDSTNEGAGSKKPQRTKTKAELAFEKQREKNVSAV